MKRWLYLLLLALVLPAGAQSRRMMMRPVSTASTPTWSSNNMTLWIVAQDLSGVANNASPLLVTNRIAGSESLTNRTGSGIVKSNSVVNGKAALWFDGTAGELATEYQTNWGAFAASEAFTAYFVVRPRASLSGNHSGLFYWTAGAERLAAWDNYAGTTYFDLPNGGAGEFSASNTAYTNSWHVLTLTRGTGTGSIRLDGAVLNTGTPSGTMTEVTLAHWTIGQCFGDRWLGDIAEIRFFKVNHAGTSEITLNEANLKATYGTP